MLFRKPFIACALKIPIISYTEASIDLYYDLPAPNASLHRGGTLPKVGSVRAEARNGGDSQLITQGYSRFIKWKQVRRERYLYRKLSQAVT